MSGRRPWCWRALSTFAIPALALPMLALPGCGPDHEASPPLPMGKVPPTLLRQLRGRGLDEWLARARSPDPAVRAEAPWALVELSSDPLVLAPRLWEALQDPDPGVRYAGVVALGRVPLTLPPELEQRLVSLLVAPERGLAKAAWASALARGAQVAPALGAALALPDERLAAQAARLLAELGPEGLAAAPALSRAVAEASELGPRLNASRALERMGPGALPALGEALATARGQGLISLLALVESRGKAAAELAPATFAVLRRASADGAGGSEEAQAAEAALLSMGQAALEVVEAAQDLPARERLLERLRAQTGR